MKSFDVRRGVVSAFVLSCSLALLLAELSIDVSLDELQTALVEFLEEGEDRTQNILISIIILLLQRLL